MTRTYSKAAWDEAQDLWRDGDFSREWRDYRHQAAMRGMIYPPDGTKWDSWDDDEPSQRAMLIRAIRETPKLTAEAISRSSSWSGVIEYILRRRDEWREDLNARERRVERDPTAGRQAMLRLSDIIQRIADSR
jgi:hypothetical protein